MLMCTYDAFAFIGLSSRARACSRLAYECLRPSLSLALSPAVCTFARRENRLARGLHFAPVGSFPHGGSFRGTFLESGDWFLFKVGIVANLRWNWR